MSDTDSFLQEVSEELRRERLYRYIRKYGWIAVVLVFIIVGAATYREHMKSQAKTEAELFGTSIIDALNETDSADRISKLQEIIAPGHNSKAIVAMLLSAEAIGNESTALEMNGLKDVAESLSVDGQYRDLLNFKILLESAEIMNVEERVKAYDALSEPGNPYRLLAEEQMALIELELGNTDNAVEKISQILLDAELSSGLRTRATQMLIALGKDPELINE